MRMMQATRFAITRRTMATVAKSIESKLQQQLKPTHLEVWNESHRHNVPENSETHFKVIIVSDQFETVPLIKRHRTVNEILKQELEGPVHALSIVAKTPSQWKILQEKSGGNFSIEPSPNCRGGDGSLPPKNNS